MQSQRKRGRKILWEVTMRKLRITINNPGNTILMSALETGPLSPTLSPPMFPHLCIILVLVVTQHYTCPMLFTACYMPLKIRLPKLTYVYFVVCNPSTCSLNYTKPFEAPGLERHLGLAM
uniref:Uncharacterized protein n=1 Tax=Opuntia streptacantha TaxID=393608 RepID=A0A7C8ZIB4_OPUST